LRILSARADGPVKKIATREKQRRPMLGTLHEIESA
jgi:hypothetical protein